MVQLVLMEGDYGRGGKEVATFVGPIRRQAEGIQQNQLIARDKRIYEVRPVGNRPGEHHEFDYGTHAG